ncbi:MAG: hypothetical protein ACHQFW_01990 [Chitinophagales bacterium]
MKRMINYIIGCAFGIMGILITSAVNAQFIPIHGCRDMYNYVSCDRNIVIIEEGLFSTSGNSIIIDIYITFIDPSSCGSPGCPINSYSVPLTNNTYFQNLGTQTLQFNGQTETVRIFRLNSLIYSAPPGYEVRIELATTSSYTGFLFLTTAYVKKCGNCIDCFSRYQLNSLYGYIKQWVFDPVWPGIPDLYDPGFPSTEQQAMVNILNYFLNIPSTQPTIDDWEDVAQFNNLPNTITPENFCEQVPECECWYDIASFYFQIITDIKNNWPASNTLPTPYEDLMSNLLMGCGCSAFYCESYQLEPSTGSGPLTSMTIYLLPVFQGNLPALIIRIEKDGPNFYSTFIYSFNMDGWNCTNGQFNIFPSCIPPILTYAGNGQFDYPDDEWGFISELLDDPYCPPPPPCENCISTYAPCPGNYILSGWTMEQDGPGMQTTYDACGIYVEFDDENNQLISSAGPFMPSGSIIDGWQKIEENFNVPSGAAKIRLKLEANEANCYFDDIRVLPIDGSMKSYVYDPVSLRLVAVLDEQHYATFFEYDEEGKLVRVKKETERGIMTINENRTSIVKQ